MTPHIAQIDVYPIRYPARRYFKFLAGAKGNGGRTGIVVKITADDGTVGWGQSVPVPTWSYETMEAALVVLRKYFAPALIGHDAHDIEGAHARMDKALAEGFSTGMPITRAGMDIALHDLNTRLDGVALAELWGRTTGNALAMSWTVNARDIGEAEETIAEGLRAGYINFNVKIGGDLAADLQLVKLVRRASPDGLLWTDANRGYAVDAALEAAPRLADAGVDILESPLPPNRISGYRALRKQAALPVFMDEGIVSPIELEEFIKLNMLDGVAMKPARCGGLWSCRRQIELIEEHGLKWLGSGLCDPDISLAASLVLFSAYGLQAAAALNAPQFLTGSILKCPIAVQGDTARVPKGPGLGIEVDEDKLLAATEHFSD